MNLAGLLGADAGELERRLGPPDRRNAVGAERWLTYRTERATVRVRCVPAASHGARPSGGRRADDWPEAGEEESTGETVSSTARPPPLRVASWIVSFREPRPTLRRAVEPLGLWPECAPDVEAGSVDRPRVRRALPAAPGGPEHSLTAGIRAGGFGRVAAFDEEPEWRE